MSISTIDNQPIIIPYTQESCKCGDDNYKQLVDFQDQLFFQVGLQCGGEQITNQSYTDAVWTYNGALYTNDGTPGGFFKPRIRPNDIFNVFEVTVLITEINAGSLNIVMQGGQTYELTTAGEHILYFNTDVMSNGTTLTPTITYFGDDFDGSFLVGTFRYAFVRGIYSNHKFMLVDADDNVVIEDADYYQPVRNTLTVGFNLDDHDALEGCFRIAYADACDNTCGQFRIDNGLFAEDTAWTLINGASINTTNDAELNLLHGGVGSPRATSQTLFCENKAYSVEIAVTKITGGQLAVRLGNSAIILINAIGVYSQTLTSTLGTELYIELSGVAGNEVDVEYIEVRYANEQPYEINGYSNTLQIGQYTGCEYVKLEGCCADDNFGFVFSGSGFIPGIRVEKRFFRALYETDIERYRNSSGDTGISYADVQKVKTLRIEQQPEYVYDFLSLLVWFDTFFINTIPYVPRGDEFPNIEWNDANDYGSINLEVIPASGLLRKVNCTNNEPSCLPTVFGDGGDYLLLENGDRMLLMDNDNLLTEG